MKHKTPKIILSALAILVLTHLPMPGTPLFDGDDPVIINPIPAIPPGGPRNNPSLEISVFYNSTLSCIYVSLSDAGDMVSVKIANEDTGEYTQALIPGTYSTFFPISGSEGVWSITFTLESGEMYGGTFII